MPVIVDAMGGDFAPREIVQGAIQAAREFGIEIHLVGPQPALETFEVAGLPIWIHHASEVVGMDEHPVRAVRKKPDASIRVAAALLRRTAGAALVSAGHTGAVMASALMDVGRMPGIDRPAIAAIVPTAGADVVVLDVGANVDSKPPHLLQFALMGAAYAQHVLDVARPRVGLLNIGSEETKGNELALATYPLLKSSQLNFVGNVEPDHVYQGEVDVVVTDGFVGNIFLKTSEGISGVFNRLIDQFLQQLGDRAGALGGFSGQLERFQASRPSYAGAPLLGVEGACIVAHGACKAETMKHAIGLASRFAASHTLETIREISARR